MVAALVGGWEAEVLREEEVGVVAVADVAGFLPCATEDTINTRLASFLNNEGDTGKYWGG